MDSSNAIILQLLVSLLLFEVTEACKLNLGYHIEEFFIFKYFPKHKKKYFYETFSTNIKVLKVKLFLKQIH